MKTHLQRRRRGLPRIAALVLVAVLSTLSLDAFADGETWSYGGIKYKHTSDENNTWVVTVIADNYSGAITIPAISTYTGNGGNVIVKHIATDAFKGNKNITSVSIGDNVTEIVADAFNGCSSLQTVTIGNGVTSIDNCAFYGCTKLSSVTLGSKVKTINGWVFQNCTSLTKITIPSSVTTIGGGAFISAGLTEVTIPSSVTNIGNTAFNTCKSLTAVVMQGTSVPTIGTEVFDNCSKNPIIYVPKGKGEAYKGVSNLNSYKSRIQEQSGLKYSKSSDGSLTVTGLESGNTDTDIVIPEKDYFSGSGTCNVTAIASDAFKGGKITSVTIPSGVTTIGDNAFSGCTSLASVTIGGTTLNAIGASAFGGCSLLKSITIPSGVKAIGDAAFAQSGLTTVTINGTALTSIGAKAFSGCTALTSITIPSSVKAIGDGAFAQSGLTTVTIGGTALASIGAKAFSGCTALTSITIPSSVTTIGDNAFNGCISLATVTSNATSVPSVGTDAFSDCKSDATLVVPNGSEKEYQKDEVWKKFMYIQSTKMLLVNDGSVIINYNYTDEGGALQVTSIDGGYSGKFTIPESVTHGSSTLKVTSIDASAFNGSTDLTSVTIPSSVKEIGASAFSGCTKLTEVISNIESPLTIDKNVFETYEATLVVPTGTMSDYQKNDVWKTFKYMKSGNVLGVNDGGIIINYNTDGNELQVTSGGTYTGDFVIPASVKYYDEVLNVTSIGKGAFEGCTGMTSVEIPNSVTSIEASAFAGCNKLATVSSKAKTPPTVADASAFGTYDATLEVPKGSESDYQSADVWKAFKGMQSSDMLAVNGGNATVNYGYTNGKKTLEVIGISDNTSTGAISIQDKVKGIPVKSIRAEAFKDCAGLTSVLISDSVTTIGKGAFSGCSSLASVNIPNGVTSISEMTFAGCTALTTMNIPSSVTSVGASAFAGCSSLAKVYLTVLDPPAAASDAFSGCKDATLYVPIGMKGKYQDAEGWKEFSKIEEYSCETIDVDDEDNGGVGYKVVSDGAGGRALEVMGGDFDESATTVTIPETVTHNGETLTVTAIGADAFSGNTVLETIEIPRSVTTIGDGAFGGCSSLESITIRSTVTTIGAGAFDGCTTLKKVIAEDIPAWCSIDFGNETANPLVQAGHIYSDENTEITNLVISENVEKIGAFAFSGGIGLKSIVISGNNLKSGLKSDLKSISYYDGVKEIGSSAFAGCSNLESVTIPSCVESIGENAFAGCTAIAEVTSNIQTPFAIASNVFESSVEATATLNVPKGTAESYQATAGWMEFSNIKEIGTSTGIEDIAGEKVTIRANSGALNISGAKDGARVVVYSMTGAKVGEARVAGGTATIATTLRRGDIAIVRIGDTAVKVMMQ